MRLHGLRDRARRGLFSKAGATTGANAIYFSTSSIGYALVTEFSD